MKNADIYINGERAVYDEKTLIGTTLRNFDLTDPSNRKQAYTNSIKLPVMKNQHIFAFASESGYQGSIPYTRISVQIIVDGYFILKDGIGYLSSIEDGYYILAIREQPDVIQTMKDRKLKDIDLTVGPLALPWAQTMLNSTSGPKLDIIYNEQSRLYSIANPTKFRTYRYNGNLTYYIHSIFTEMSALDGITFTGSLLSDSYFLNARLLCSQIGMHRATGGTVLHAYNIIANPDKTFWDLFKVILQMFGAVYTIDGATITLQKYDDVSLTKIDWTGKLHKVKSKKFRIKGIGQNNYMRYKAQDEADKGLNESVWTCANKNIENDNVIIKPDVSVYPFLNLNELMTGASTGDTSIFIPDSEYDIVTDSGGTTQTIVKGLSDFVIVVDGNRFIQAGTDIEMEYTWQTFAATYTDIHTTVVGDNRSIATYYSSQNDYLRFAAMIEDPVAYEVEINLNVLDLHDYDPINLAIIPELAGEFYVNSLQYNYEKQGKASKASIIKYVEP